MLQNMLNFKFIYLHLFVICASLAFSDENCSSKSNRSRDGAGNSLNCGGNTAGCKGGNGVSKLGVIKVNCSCLQFNESYAL